MGIFTRDRTVSSGIASPWADSSHLLPGIVADDIFGLDIAATGPVARSLAMTVPAVAKGRNLLVETIAKLPLVALNADGTPVAVQPTFLYRTDGAVSPYSRMVMTADDCIMFGSSLWLTDRGANGQIVRAEWIPFDRWSIREDTIFIDGQYPLTAQDFILFDVPGWDGLLTVAAPTIRGALNTEAAWQSRMEHPIFITELHVLDDSAQDMDQTALDAWAKTWAANHKAGQPSFGVTPAGVEIRTHGEAGDAELFLGNRNAIRNDIGAFLNIPASMMDGSLAEASLTYTTTEGNRNLFYELADIWISPIEQALSVDKSVPRGQRVRFEKTEQYAPTPNPTSAPEED